ncbi:MAG: hypothetical protein HJJLKODD_02233 [Phycisphaerae bacterium]|nr:hypothetical protein [Phycisphaerae bacterium]
MLSVDEFRLLTFDCYGTLIDWESGIRTALRDLLADVQVTWSEALFDRYLAIEATHEQPPWRPYRQVLSDSQQQLLTELAISQSVAPRLADSLADWRPFADTIPALTKLSSKFELGILSNIDDKLLNHSLRRMNIPFKQLITAEQVHSYKPAHAHWQTLLQRTGYPRSAILHVAQSRYHDILPCNELGITSVWINRRGETTGPGIPDAEFPDLKSFAQQIFGDQRSGELQSAGGEA